MIQRDSRFCASSSLFLVLSCPWLVIRYSVVGLLCFCMISIALIDMYVIHNFLFNWRLLSVWKYAVVICMQPNHAFFSNFFSEKKCLLYTSFQKKMPSLHFFCALFSVFFMILGVNYWHLLQIEDFVQRKFYLIFYPFAVLKKITCSYLTQSVLLSYR